MERRYDLDRDWKIYIRAIKEGCKADKSLIKKGSTTKPGDWLIKPYSEYRIRQVLKAIEKGRLKEKMISK